MADREHEEIIAGSFAIAGGKGLLENGYRFAVLVDAVEGEAERIEVGRMSGRQGDGPACQRQGAGRGPTRSRPGNQLPGQVVAGQGQALADLRPAGLRGEQTLIVGDGLLAIFDRSELDPFVELARQYTKSGWRRWPRI